jgi:hypothetical protein
MHVLLGLQRVATEGWMQIQAEREEMLAEALQDASKDKSTAGAGEKAYTFCWLTMLMGLRQIT